MRDAGRLQSLATHILHKPLQRNPQLEQALEVDKLFRFAAAPLLVTQWAQLSISAVRIVKRSSFSRCHTKSSSKRTSSSPKWCRLGVARRLGHSVKQPSTIKRRDKWLRSCMYACVISFRAAHVNDNVDQGGLGYPSLYLLAKALQGIGLPIGTSKSVCGKSTQLRLIAPLSHSVWTTIPYGQEIGWDPPMVGVQRDTFLGARRSLLALMVVSRWRVCPQRIWARHLYARSIRGTTAAGLLLPIRAAAWASCMSEGDSTLGREQWPRKGQPCWPLVITRYLYVVQICIWMGLSTSEASIPRACMSLSPGLP